MSNLLEIVVALVVVSVFSPYIRRVLGFFAIMPDYLYAYFSIAVSLVIILFIIHRK